MHLTLTPQATERLGQVLQNLPNPTPQRGIRVAVKSGGCNGYEYDLKIAKAPKPDDTILTPQHLRVFIDPKSALLLDGLTIDYIEGLVDSGFKFINPNVVTCSCGKSFQSGDCATAGATCG